MKPGVSVSGGREKPATGVPRHASLSCPPYHLPFHDSPIVTEPIHVPSTCGLSRKFDFRWRIKARPCLALYPLFLHGPPNQYL